MKRKFILKLIDKYNLATTSRVETQCYKRYYLYYLLSKTGMSLSSIARAFGKGHATVIHGIKEHKKWHKIQDERYMDTIKNVDGGDAVL
jgi:chromosomal replication initiation ATPase DnaA